jgi:uncharacterized protein (UPF0332 family)
VPDSTELKEWTEGARFVSELLQSHVQDQPVSAIQRIALRRAAVSRAYYAAYYFAKAWALTQNFREENDLGKHRQLWKWYYRHNGIVDVCGAGQELHELRVNADYKPSELISDMTIDEVLDASADLIDLVRDVSERISGARY